MRGLLWVIGLSLGGYVSQQTFNAYDSIKAKRNVPEIILTMPTLSDSTKRDTAHLHYEDINLLYFPPQPEKNPSFIDKMLDSLERESDQI